MARLKVRSERYLLSTRVQTDTGGRRTAFNGSDLGEVILSPAESEIFSLGSTRTPLRLAIGPDLYSYSSQFARCDGGRPWMRKTDAQGSASFPYHELPGDTHDYGGDPYAGLVGLIATAHNEVRVLGPATVDGQRTTEFTAVVDPAPLLAGISEGKLEPEILGNEDLMIAQLKLRSVPTHLWVFIARSGLPVRVVTSARITPGYLDTETTEVLAVNVPIEVRRPAVGRTISMAEAVDLFANDSRRCGIHTVGAEAIMREK